MKFYVNIENKVPSNCDFWKETVQVPRKFAMKKYPQKD